MSQQTLDILIGLAREARDKAAQLLAGERSNSRQIAEQMNLLETYRREYGQQLQQLADQGIDLARLQNYQAFLASLDRAIEQARQGLNDQTRKVNRCQQNWQQEQQRLSSYDLLQERRKAQEALREQRREMLRNDEFSAGFASRARRQAGDDLS